MAGMTLLLKISSVKLYEDDGNGTWKDCSANSCVLVISRNPQGLSCSILDKNTRQPCFNRWLTPKVVITHDREDWIGWSESSKEGLKAFGIKMKPAECLQFVDLISAQVPRASPASSQTASLNPTPAPSQAEAAQLQSSSSAPSPRRPTSSSFGTQQSQPLAASANVSPRSQQLQLGAASLPDTRRPSAAADTEEDRASPRSVQGGMAAQIMMQRKRLQTLKESADDELQRENLLMDLAKKGAADVAQKSAESFLRHSPAVERKPAFVSSKRSSLVEAAAFVSQVKDKKGHDSFAAQTLDLNEMVWVEHEHEGFIAYRVKQRGLTSVMLVPADPNLASDEPLTVTAKEFEGMYRVTQFDPDQTSDVSLLGEFVSEPLVLAVLRERHHRKLVFTMMSDMLISVNPLTDVPLYNARVMENYIRLGAQHLPPHAFGFASNVKRQLLQQRDPQNIVICGEQCSGKTETTKILIKFFGGLGGSSSCSVSEKLHCASFILDSFGNAASHRNVNSSRFSKYMNLQVQPGTGDLIGANIETLLLEVCRLSDCPVMERSFHVFYYLIAPGLGDDANRLKANLNLPDVSASQMALLGADLGQVEEAQDSKNFGTLLSAFTLLGFSQQEVTSVFSVVAACLHLKELKFYESDQIAKIRAGLESFETACELLGVSSDKMKEAIMSKSIRVMGQTSSVQNLGTAACEASIMSLISTLYSSLFDWLLHRINTAIGAPPSVAALSLGILDMAGFESIKINGFSQLCFNYGSEKIHELFTAKAMLEEIQLYRDEGLKDVKIDVSHNDPLIQFYEDKTFGLFAIIDAQSRLPNGSDEGMLNVLLQNLSNTSAPSHISSRVYDRNPKSTTSFIVKHHAGQVNYNITGMLFANKETHLRDDIMATLRSSMFENVLKMLPKANASASVGGPVKATAKVVGSSTMFKDQLFNLSQRLRASHCHFIRCFSPNTEENPEAFDGAFMLSQLRSSGLFEAVSLRMRGYPFRKNLDAFVSMYRALVTSQTHSTPKLMCRKIISNVFGKGDDIHVGESMVFYKISHHKTLEAALQKSVFGQALTIQRNFRARIARSAVRKLLQIQVACTSIMQRLRGLKLDELLRREVKQTLQQFGDVQLPGVFALQKLVLRAEETEPLERQMLELLQQGNSVAASDMLSAQMRELLRRADVLGIESDIIEKGRRLNAQTVVRMERRRELAQFASSTDLEELENQVERAKDESLQETPEFFDLNRQLIRIRREFCVVLIIEHAMTRGSFTSQDGARNVDVKHLKGALARADLIKSFQPHYQQRIARARMLLDLRECIQIGAWADAQAILESLMQEGLENDETSALKLHFASTSKISDVLSQIKDAVLNPSRLEQGKLEVLMAKAEHARLTGPDVAKLRELLNRVQATKGLLEQAVVEKKEAQLIQALQEGRELGLSSILLEEGERTLQRIIERKNKRLLAKNQGSTPAMQAIALASAPFASSAAPSSQNGSVVLEDAPSSATAPKLSLIQEENAAAQRFALSMASLSPQEKRIADAVAQHVQARDLEAAVAEQTALRTSFFQRMASKFELSNVPTLRANISGKPVFGWSSHARETSFLVVEPSQTAVRMFNDVLCIMGDKMALYPEMLSNELLSQVSQQPLLRDELVMQLCSQLTNNPSAESAGRGWEFLEKVLLNGAVSHDAEAQLDLFIRKNSPTQAKHLFAHYIGAPPPFNIPRMPQPDVTPPGQLGLIPEYTLRTKRKEEARTKSLFGVKSFANFARRSVFR